MARKDKAMTDKQIASVYVASKIGNLIPDHESLRSIAGSELTEARCYRIIERIVHMIEKIREPLVRYLSAHKIDMV